MCLLYTVRAQLEWVWCAVELVLVLSVRVLAQAYEPPTCVEQPLDQWAGVLAAVCFTVSFSVYIYDAVWGAHGDSWVHMGHWGASAPPSPARPPGCVQARARCVTA